jgi:peptidyl-prolyl cis-trans isomerase C
VCTPTADTETCRRYYEQNRQQFRSADIYEVAHILFAANRAETKSFQEAQVAAGAALAVLRERPEQFGEFARAHSACPSSSQDGNLGQITQGQTTPEFEEALLELLPGSIGPHPVETRYGVHIIRLDRKLAGRELPFELVAGRIAEYLQETVQRRALAQYVARLARDARIEGIDLPSTESMRVN